MGVVELEDLTHDSLAAIAYHGGDGFETTEGSQRIGYYGVTGYPTVVFQGVDRVIGGSSTQSQYYRYRPVFDTWVDNSTPVYLVLEGSYDPGTRAGTVTTHFMNCGSSPVTGNLLLALTETSIAYPWQTQDSLYHVQRDMIPDAVGEGVSIPGRGVLDRTYDFAVDPGWNERFCQIVAFLQNTSTKEVYQVAKWAVLPKVSVAVAPDTVPVIIPARGGSVGYTIDLVNNTPRSQTFDLWGQTVLPGGRARTTFAPRSMTLNPHQSVNAHYNMQIPARAPAGNYTFVLRVGTAPAQTWDDGYFAAVKTRTDESRLSLQVCPAH